MKLYTIATVRFSMTPTRTPQELSKAFKEKKWYQEGTDHIKDDGIGKYAIRRISEGDMLLTIEQLDLFSIDMGEWTPQTHEERETILQETLQELTAIFNAILKIREVTRKVGV